MDTSIHTEFITAYSVLKNTLFKWMNDFIENLPYILLSIIVVFLFTFLAKISKRLFRRIFDSFSPSNSLKQLFSNIIYLIIFIIGIVIALSVLKLEKTVTSLLAGAGIIGLALGLAFQDITVNIISGAIIAVRKPFIIGDLIQTNDIFGTVRDIRLRTIEIESQEGQIITIPSRIVLQNPLINYTISGKRRVDFIVGISYGEDLERVKGITLEALESLGDLIIKRPIEFYYTEFGDSSINFIVRFWIHYVREGDFLNARSEAILAIKDAYNKNDITIPFPIRTVDFGIKGGEKLSEMFERGDFKQDKG